MAKDQTKIETIKEAQLRLWLRSVCGNVVPLTWCEPNFGSSVGVPDAQIMVTDGSWVEIELKVWKRRKDNSFVADIRPAQIRYHYMSRTWKKSTFILFVCPVVGFPGKWELRILSGRMVPLEGNRIEEEQTRYVCDFSKRVTTYNKPVFRAALLSSLAATKEMSE